VPWVVRLVITTTEWRGDDDITSAAGRPASISRAAIADDVMPPGLSTPIANAQLTGKITGITAPDTTRRTLGGKSRRQAYL
jgi:hypothetical protein